MNSEHQFAISCRVLIPISLGVSPFMPLKVGEVNGGSADRMPQRVLNISLVGRSRPRFRVSNYEGVRESKVKP